MALWCRRKYQEYFIRERDAFDVADIFAGEVYTGINEEPMWSETIQSERTLEAIIQGPNDLAMAMDTLDQSPMKLDSDRSNVIKSQRSQS